MIEATSANGNPVVVRTWPRRGGDDEDLVDIWRHELRQLHKLSGYPGAQKFIARIADAGVDAKGFHIVIDAGQRVPLESLLQRGRGSTSWLRALSLPANRRRLWTNLQSVARGLEILHNEGLVHRNLDGWAILTSAGDDPDFQLTGFEWSLRLSAAADAAGSRPGPDVQSVSFAGDWADFAKLGARLFNINLERLLDQKLPDYDVHEGTPAAEIRLLRQLMSAVDLPRLDAEVVVRRIDQLLDVLEVAESAVDARYHLVLRLNRDSPLSASVRAASGSAIDIDDAAAQLAWIKADLGQDVDLVAAREGTGSVFFLRGTELVYRIKQYRGTSGEPSWQFAYCETADAASTWRRGQLDRVQLPCAAINFLQLSTARDLFSRVRGRVPALTRLFERIKDTGTRAVSREAATHRALTLLHGIEIAFAAADAFPVEVLATSRADSLSVELVYRPVAELETLSVALGLTPPQQRLREYLEEEKFDASEGWIFSEDFSLGQPQPTDVELTFEGLQQQSGAMVLRFRSQRPAALVRRDGFLTSAGSRGSFVQFRRRANALGLLKQYDELLGAMSDARSRITSSHDVVVEDAGYQGLDVAKQEALKSLFAVLPIYFVQGPPGVGKTYLIRDIVRRCFDGDRTARLLVTAQGNHAIDHLLDELADVWAAQPDSAPLSVRCRARDDTTNAGPVDLQDMTTRMLAAVTASALAKRAPSAIQARLQAVSGIPSKQNPAAAGAERRAIEALLLRSANLVFATSNSSDLARLLDEKGQFDWTIIEEAGKATGCELATPLMLSHRRLMIGDHKQLPPFNSEKFEALLDRADASRAALGSLSRLNFRRDILDEVLLDLAEDEEVDFEQLCTDAKRVLYMFETGLTAELQRLERSPGGKRIASTLSVQHRMHPVICEAVSETFYSGLLTTSPDREVSARAQARAVTSENPALLPETPLVLIDMPYERSEIGGGRVEQLPRFSNESEVREVVKAISQLRVESMGDKQPSLVVLSPYQRQVNRLRESILADGHAAAALSSFRPVARGGDWCSTVDAFQGNEADVVIFSLVRNNRGATLRRALGFVGDRRRFNVLLSRARLRFIFVGSQDFLAAVANPLGTEDSDAAFLKNFLSVVARLEKQGDIARVRVERSHT
jgi:hypothetical protein